MSLFLNEPGKQAGNRAGNKPGEQAGRKAGKKQGKINAVIALQKPVRPVTVKNLRGLLFF